MSYEKCISICKMFSIVLLVICFTTISFAQDTTKWIARGTNPQDYEMGGDPTIDHGSGEPAFVISKVDSIKGFGTWMIEVPIEEYLGKRLIMSSYVKTEDGTDWVGLWMRVDGEDNGSLAFDNMDDRSIRGTTDWKEYSIVLDVHKEGVKMFCGLGLGGTGKAWFDGLKFEIVGDEVPVTRGLDYETLYALGEYKKALLYFEKVIKSNPDHVYSKIWYYLTLKRDNQVDKAQKYLTEFSDKPIKDKWEKNIVDYYTGSLTEDDFLNAANDTSATKEKENKCEAYFYIGMNNLFQDNQEKAKECFEKCLEHEVKGFVEPKFAKVELDRMNKK